MVDMARLTFISMATEIAKARDFIETPQLKRRPIVTDANPYRSGKFSN